MASFCNQCGNALPEGAVFCGSCGATAAAIVPPPPGTPLSPAPTYAPAPAYAPPPPRSNAAIWVLVAAVIIILAVAVGYLALNRAKPAADASVVGTEAAALPDTAPAAGAPIGPEVTKYVTTVTNIRSMATAQDPASRIVQRLPAGSAVRGTIHPGIVPSTFWLQLTDGRGWVSVANLSDAPPVATPVIARSFSVTGRCSAAIKDGNLRIRNAPGGRIIGAVRANTGFDMIDDLVAGPGGSWMRIRLDGQAQPAGWVAADLVECGGE